MTLPIITDSPSGAIVLGGTVLFDLIALDESWGRWGIELDMLLPTATDEELGSEKWAAGPVIGFVARDNKLMRGVFNEKFFACAGAFDREDIKVTILQPIINYSLPHKWSIGVSEMNITYDWKKSDWNGLPLGLKLATLFKFGKLPVQISGFYEYNFADDYVSPEWTVNFTLKRLFPI